MVLNMTNQVSDHGQRMQISQFVSKTEGACSQVVNLMTLGN